MEKCEKRIMFSDKVLNRIFTFINSIRGVIMHYYEEMYLDYVNNFLSIERFAEYYGITGKHAMAIIDIISSFFIFFKFQKLMYFSHSYLFPGC